MNYRKIKILNLFAGIGGNRKLWDDLKNIEVTSVEINAQIAAVYKSFFPNDKVIIGDAHQYLLEHYAEFDFIWSSPPCQSHSSFRQNICVRFRGTQPKYPDFKLYEQIIFLQYNCKSKWVVENVNPYYKPLIQGKLIQRHLFWSNFDIPSIEIESENIRTIQIPDLEKLHGFDLSNIRIANKRQILRNCINPELGYHILKNAKINSHALQLQTVPQKLENRN